jgi:Z1 domain
LPIDPDTDDEALKQDLFPRHFIIGLDAPSNYFGAQKVFIDGHDRHVRLIEDNEDVFPMKHKIDDQVEVLPESLVQAVRTFIVARAIRNANGQQANHASMLVNASRFTDVQGRLRSRITDVVGRIRDAVAVDAGKGQAALKNHEIASLHEIWKQEFEALNDAEWPAIQSRLHEVLIAARVVEVNASKRSQALDYDQGGEHGVTVIAVGGFSLSRGLTLEGLTVSYFLRNSIMYDTLMQMGRWFGYRNGYEDLCRVWMPADGVGWYAHIHGAMDDLQAQLKRMELAKATPEQFGLAVRSHPETLIVTARNKMGSGKEFPVKVGLAKEMVETTRLKNEVAQLVQNRAAGDALAEAIATSGRVPESGRRDSLFLSVPVELISTFLNSFRADPANLRTDAKLIGDYIAARSDSELKVWDVLFASAQNDDVQADTLSGLIMKPFGRKVADDKLREGTLTISGTSLRVGSPGDERVGLTSQQIKTAIDEFSGPLRDVGKTVPTTLPPRIFREIEGRRPLIILRFVNPIIADESLKSRLLGNVLAWSIHFPSSNIEGGTVEYVVNTIRMREMFGEEEIEEETAGDPE